MVPYLGPLEYVFNTPSSHRVHHGRNKYCIDKNYAGTLIIWDRMFGTYVKEKDDEEIAYGLVTNVNTFNQLYCQLFEFKTLGWDNGQMKDEKGNEIFPGTWNKVKAALWPPGWFPGVQTKFYFAWLCMKDPTEGIPEIEYPVIRHDRPLTKPLKIYLFLSWIGLVAAALKYNEQLKIFVFDLFENSTYVYQDCHDFDGVEFNYGVFRTYYWFGDYLVLLRCSGFIADCSHLVFELNHEKRNLQTVHEGFGTDPNVRDLYHCDLGARRVLKPTAEVVIGGQGFIPLVCPVFNNICFVPPNPFVRGKQKNYSYDVFNRQSPLR